MSKRNDAKAPATNEVIGKEMDVPIDQIKPSRFQKRVFDKDAEAGLKGMADTIRTDGILQRPLVIRDGKDKKHPFELVFGERRWRAGKIAGLETLPVLLVDWPDDRIRKAHLIENLQRENLHPLDEAATAVELRDSETPPMQIRELALHVGKSERETARLVALPSLIPKAQDYFRKGMISRGHADQLARLSPEVQPEALDQCFEQEHVKYDSARGVQIYRPILTAPTTANALNNYIARHLTRDLAKAPWQLDDDKLVPEQGACSTCPFNTAANLLLFGDAVQPGQAICTNAEGFERKMSAWIDSEIERLTVDGKRPPLLFGKPSYNVTTPDKKKWPDALFIDGYHPAQSKADKCGYAVAGLFVIGESAGKTAMICVEPTCPSHAGRRVSGSSAKKNTRSAEPVKKSASEQKKFNERKQEIFNIRVADVVRLEVFRLAVPTFKSGPIDRRWRERMTAEAFVRLPHYDSDVINTIMGLELDADAHEMPELIVALQKLDDAVLTRLMYFCAFSHYGANPGQHTAVDQSRVARLAQERGVNYLLADATARVALSSKKYKARHEAYLEAVQKGGTPPLPRIYGDPAASEPAKGKQTRPAAKGAQKKASKRVSRTKARKSGKKR